MRENEPVLLILFVCEGEIILEKGEFYLRNVNDKTLDVILRVAKNL